MRKLLTLYLITLSMVHLEVMGPIRYLFCSVIIALILIVENKVFISKSYTYNLGGILLIGGGLFASVDMGNLTSLAYVLFITINFMLYPGFEKYHLPRRYVLYTAFYLLLTVMYVNDFSSVRGNNLYGNPNNYATVTLCAAYFGILGFKGKPLYQLLTVPVFLFFIFISASRTQLTGLLLFYGLYFSQQYVLRTHLRRTIFFFLLIIFALYGTMITGDPFNIVGTVQDNTYGHKSYRGLSYRDVLFFASIDILAKYPQGVGWGLSGVYIYDYMGETLSPHNTFMKVAVEGGWVSLVGFLTIILGRLWNAATPLVSSFMIAVLLRGLFESSTPFTLSFISAMLLIPFFLNETTVTETTPKSAAVIAAT